MQDAGEAFHFMVRSSRNGSPLWWRKGSTFFLALSWCLGLISGIVLFLFAGTQILPWMRSTAYGAVSIVGLLCVTLLPFLFSAFAVFISEPWLLLPISYGKAVLFSLISLGILQSFGSAGWLVRLLLMFSDSVSVPLLYCFWHRHISGRRKLAFSEAWNAVSLCILIGSIDYCLVSPFLAQMIHS